MCALVYFESLCVCVCEQCGLFVCHWMCLCGRVGGCAYRAKHSSCILVHATAFSLAGRELSASSIATCPCKAACRFAHIALCFAPSSTDVLQYRAPVPCPAGFHYYSDNSRRRGSSSCLRVYPPATHDEALGVCGSLESDANRFYSHILRPYGLTGAFRSSLCRSTMFPFGCLLLHSTH